jgi:hypothetical protein
MKKKAQGLPMETIIIAALVIIVLVILAIIMGVRFNLFGSTTKSCTAQKGECLADGDYPGVSTTIPASCGDDRAYIKGTDCESLDPKQICCMDVFVQN